MSALFSINFRREAYLKEVAKARRRVWALAAWVMYFGLFAVVLGLWGLNCASLSRRTGLVERQTAHLRSAEGTGAGWSFSQAELSQVERYALNPRRWRNRLMRLSEVLPTNVRITSLESRGRPGSARSDQLSIVGYIKPRPEQDQMQGAMQVVQTLQADSLFSQSYLSIKLTSTRVLDGSDGTAEFEIECQ